MLTNKSEEYSAYIIVGDIVDSASIPFDNIVSFINQFFNKLGECITSCSFNDTCLICTYPTGDGFTTVIVFNEHDEFGMHSNRYSNLVIRLCYDLLSLFRKDNDLKLRMAVHKGSVSCFNFNYRNQSINSQNSFDYYIGRSIEHCNRIMSFGDAGHLIASQEFRENYKKIEIENRKSVLFHFRPESFHDKKGIVYPFYVAYEEKGRVLNAKTPSLKNPNPVLNSKNTNYFTKKIKTCSTFLSTSNTPAKSWLIDNALISVLIQQARTKTRKERNFQRVFIWNNELQEAQHAYEDCVINYHNIAGVTYKKITPKKYLECINEDLANLRATNTLMDVVKDPIKEAWICCPNNCDMDLGTCIGCNELEGGYGTYNNKTGRYEIKKLSYSTDNGTVIAFKNLIYKIFDNAE